MQREATRRSVTRRPNILWICADQLRHDALGFAGQYAVHTPNLDRLARTGVWFPHAFAQGTLCMPSRASMLTGRYPAATRVREEGQDIPADEVPVTRILADNGWRCGLVGKLHLSHCQGVRMERRIADGFEVFRWSHAPHHPSPDNSYRNWLRGRLGPGREPALPDDWVTVAARGGNMLEYWCRDGGASELHHSAWAVEEAMELIASDDARPWCLCLNFFAPHPPFDPPPEYLALYDPDDIPDPVWATGELSWLPAAWRVAKDRELSFSALTPRERRLVKSYYYALVSHLDAQIGRLLEFLAATGKLGDTLIIFTSDHGEMLGDHGLYFKGPRFYDSVVRVPLVLSWPGVLPGGLRSDALVELVDLAPTILEACGIDIPRRMQGRSLWPVLREGRPEAPHRDYVYCEFFDSRAEYVPTPSGVMYRDRRYKVVVWHGLDHGEIYDLEGDPHELRNLWHDTTPERRLELVLQAFAAAARTADPGQERVSRY